MSFRRALMLVMVVFATAAAACTGDGNPSPGATGASPPTPTVSQLPTEDEGPVPFEPGLFRYAFNGVEAELRWEGGEGELIVDNGSDRELSEPGLYAMTSDQREVPGDVEDTAPIPPGKSSSFAITFPDSVTFEETGFVVLLFGEENWGAFAPVPKAEV